MHVHGIVAIKYTHSIFTPLHKKIRTLSRGRRSLPRLCTTRHLQQNQVMNQNGRGVLNVYVPDAGPRRAVREHPWEHPPTPGFAIQPGAILDFGLWILARAPSPGAVQTLEIGSSELVDMTRKKR